MTQYTENHEHSEMTVESNLRKWSMYATRQVISNADFSISKYHHYAQNGYSAASNGLFGFEIK